MEGIDFLQHWDGGMAIGLLILYAWRMDKQRKVDKAEHKAEIKEYRDLLTAEQDRNRQLQAEEAAKRAKIYRKVDRLEAFLVEFATMGVQAKSSGFNGPLSALLKRYQGWRKRNPDDDG